MRVTNMQLIASIGSIVAIWRLDAINMAKMGQVPVYKRWRLDGTLPMRGQLVSTTSITHGMYSFVLPFRQTCYRQQYPFVCLDQRYACQFPVAHGLVRSVRIPLLTVRTPRPLLRVRWSPQGEYVAAVPLVRNGSLTVRPIHASWYGMYPRRILPK